MKRSALDNSLALWTERETRFRRNWKSKRKRDPRRFYWFQQLKLAVRMVNRREDQLRMLGVTGVAAAGVALVKEFEGFRARPYRDPVGVWTVGYGETRGVSRFTRPVTEPQAAAQLRRRLDRDYFPAVKALPVFRRLNQNQVDALTSFVYNVGPAGVGPDSSVGKALRQDHFKSAAEFLLDWNRAGGHVLAGLSRRRQAERALFLKA
jgi:GH24 family phage-related lysozyme (muramidase)